jgi:hypothetical protein
LSAYISEREYQRNQLRAVAEVTVVPFHVVWLGIQPGIGVLGVPAASPGPCWASAP